MNTKSKAMGKWMWRALLATAAMNLFGALLFVPAFPVLRVALGMPNLVHPLYLWIVAIWIFVFWLSLAHRLGVVSSRWIAVQKRFHR